MKKVGKVEVMSYPKSKLPFFQAIFALLSYVLLSHFFEWPCPFREIFGFPSPTCGMTRAFISLLEFDFRESFYYHPLLIPMIFIVGAACYRDYHELLLVQERIFNVLCCSVGILVLVIYLFRLNYNLIP